MPQLGILQEPVLLTSNEVSSVDFLPRWQPNGDPLYHRRLETYHFDMCAESLGMPKVALCFLTRGPVHQVSCQQILLQKGYMFTLYNLRLKPPGLGAAVGDALAGVAEASRWAGAAARCGG